MKRCVIGDQLDVAEFMKRGFVVGIISVDCKIPSSGGSLFTLPSLFPNPMGLKLIRENKIEDFRRKYMEQLNSPECSSVIAALLYGIIDHHKPILLIRYFNEIKKMNIETQEEDFVKFNFLTILKEFLYNKYGVECITTSKFDEAYAKNMTPFFEGHVKGEHFENYRDLKGQYAELFMEDAPTKEELEEVESKNEYRQLFTKVNSITVNKNDNDDAFSKVLDIKPDNITLTMLRMMSDDELVRYITHYGLVNAVLAKFRVAKVLDSPRAALVSYIKYGV